MDPVATTIIFGGILTLGVAASSVFRLAASRLARQATGGPAWRRRGEGQAFRVRVKGAYEPDTIVVRAELPVRITFRREETAPCSERVVFPALGVSAMLPPFEDVTLVLVPQAGEYEFTCQMGVLRGRLIAH